MNDHGIFSLNLDGNILTVEGCGPWNMEAMKISFANAELMLEIRGKVKWGIIAIIHGDPVHTPDAAELLVEQIIEDKKHGRIATAFILSDSTAPYFGKLHFSELCAKADETCGFFDNVTDADIWMKTKLAE
ncbi:hypothetical protein ACLKMH_08455 [Psychromonas sp. KJ10-10]|uniref:hypothetical protein n=1 Tax=Psychromonas sp. KJ10-10 TaxID=3391823 RepID=UPI0039B54261